MQRWYYASVAGALAPLQEFDAYREFVDLLPRVFGETGSPEAEGAAGK